MTTRIVFGILMVVLVLSARAVAQSPEQRPFVDRYVDRVNGLSLEQATARALAQEPSLRAARAGVDVARGMRQQASLHPNPSTSFEWRDEPTGTDNQVMVGVQWPLFRVRSSRNLLT